MGRAHLVLGMVMPQQRESLMRCGRRIISYTSEVSATTPISILVKPQESSDVCDLPGEGWRSFLMLQHTGREQDDEESQIPVRGKLNAGGRVMKEWCARQDLNL